jgi:integrase
MQSTQTFPLPFNIEAETTRLRLESSKFTGSKAKLSLNSQLGYGYDWRMFLVFCRRMEREPLPASVETVSFYVAYLLAEGKKVTTATRRVSAIAHMHRDQGMESPVTGHIRAMLRAAQRMKAEQPRQTHALTVAQLRAIATVLTEDGGRRAIRNRAVLVLGFSSALRRANLTDLRLSDVEFSDRGLVLHVRREKQDKTSRGRLIGVPPGNDPVTCPVRCLQAWLELRGQAQGYLFTHVERGAEERGLRPEAIERMVKACVRKIGVAPQGYSGHSLRAGFITAAGEAEIGELLIAAQSGHRSMNVLRRYFRRRDLFKANAASKVGL